MTKIGSPFGDQILAQLRDMQTQMRQMSNSASDESKGKGKGASFMEHLQESVQEVNVMQKDADKMAVDVATGKSDNLHETMLAATKAELSFNLMVQVRNKVLEAYQEVMRMQV